MKRKMTCAIETLENRMLFASAAVNWSDVRQSIDGFGASTAWMWGTIPAAGLDQAFSTTTGAGLSLLRTHIFPSGWSSESDVMQQMGNQGVRVWSTPWSPPREWKTNHDNNNGGSLDPAHYQDYANLLADYVQDMKGKGVSLYALSLQNEPNWTATYESARWDAQQFAAFIPYVGQTFAARGITTKIMLPESLNWDFSLANQVLADPALAQYVGILGAHNYGETTGSYKPVTNAGGRPVWETENTVFNGSTPIANAVDVADDVHQALADANASAYHYWWLNANDPYSGLMDGNWNANKRLWALGQYSRFVRPGWVRIGETDDGGGLDVTTFKDPTSGKFAIVVVNTNTTGSVTENYTLNGFTADSVTPYVTSATDDLKAYAPISLAGGTGFSHTIAANSIVTYYGVSDAAPTLQAPAGLTAAPAYGSGNTQIALTWTNNSTSETGYTVERSTNGTDWTIISSTLPTDTTRYVDTGRAENTLYYYRVKATSGATSSAYSAVASASTLLVAPNRWSITGARLSGGVQLNWSVDSAVSTGVRIDRSLDGLTWTNVANLATRATSYVDTFAGYDPNQIYHYRVRNTASSSYSGFTTWNSGLATPTDFAATQVGPNGITFTWTSPTIGATGAWIERYNAADGSWSQVSPSSLRATDGTWRLAGLTPSTSYTFRMRTSSTADSLWSAYTGNLNVTTPAPSASPLVWYQANESSGTALADASNNGNTAVLSGSYSFGPGAGGNALRLTGGYATLPTDIVAGLNDFTIATWVNLSSSSDWARVFDFGSGTGRYMFFVPRAGGTGMPRFAITANGLGSEQQINSSVAIPTNAWTHIAVTLSGNTATLYINGTVAGTNANMTVHPAALGSTTRNRIGKSQYDWDPALQGSVDDFRLYGRGLSATEVAALSTPTVATPAGASPSTVTATTTDLSVLGADATCGESALTYTWAATGAPPAPVTLSANGTNAAKNVVATFTKAGTYNFLVTISNQAGRSATSAVSVTVEQTLKKITVSSTSSSAVAAGTTRQFTASPLDQFDQPMTATVAWSTTGGANAISSTGLFTAGTIAGSYTVTAGSGAVSGSLDTMVTSIFTGQADIGTVAQAGSSSVAGGLYTVKGAGADIWGSADNFHYLYASLTGDGQIIARVTGVQNSNSFAKAGVMIRSSLASNAQAAMVALTPGAGVTFQFRKTTGGSTASVKTAGITAPYWVKLVRTGNTFAAFRSSDGATWTANGSAVTIAMSTTAYVGLAVTAHDAAALNTSTFSNVSITRYTNLALNNIATASSTQSGLSAANAVDGSITTSWQSASAGTQWLKVDLGATHAVGRIALTWGSSYARGYQVQYSTDNSTWKNAYSTSSGAGGVLTLTNLNLSARFIRLWATTANASTYDVQELYVSGI